MAKYIFRLDRMKVYFQRGKKDDRDVVTFAIQIGERQYGLTRVIDHIRSGLLVEFSNFPPVTLEGRSNENWELGPIKVQSDDIVEIIYSGVNTSDSDALITDKEAVSITFAVLEAAAGDKLGPFMNIAGEIVGALFPEKPKCNGVAFAERISFLDAKLSRETQTATGLREFVVTRKSINPDLPEDCGHPPDTDVTFSVRLVPFESVREFLGSKGDLRLGINRIGRMLQPTEPVISVRSLIEPSPRK
jgi:hypothetical protein